MSPQVTSLLIFLGLAFLTFFLVGRFDERVRMAALMRVPLLFAGGLILLPGAGIFLEIGTVENLLTLERPYDLYFVTLFAMLFAWLCGLSILLTWEHGLERIGQQNRPLPYFWATRRLLRIFPFSLIAAPLLIVVTMQSAPYISWWQPLGAGIGTAIVFFIAVALIRAVLLKLTDASRSTFIGRTVLAKLPPAMSAGYLDTDKNRTYPGHGTATAFAVAMGIAYVVGQHQLDPRYVEEPPLPALGYLLALLTLHVVVLSGAAFFFDRFRVPLLLILFAWFMLSYVGSETDHTFPVYAVDSPEPVTLPTVAETVSPWIDSETKRRAEEQADNAKPPLIIICASGGGIQASAWTTRVLTWVAESLEEEEAGLGQRFIRSIRLVSSTSGGSVGSMYFLEALRREGDELASNTDALQAVREAGSRSSLSETGWGLVFPDFQRAFFPFYVAPEQDRAWAMEHAWRRSLDRRRPIQSRWSNWTADAGKGNLPGVVFNSFVIESGDRMLFSTVDIDGLHGARTFANLYGDEAQQPTGDDKVPLTADVDVVTAARMSATFPYITPIAKAAWQGDEDRPLPTLHLADGAYFDNFGVMAAVEWIHDLMQSDGPIGTDGQPTAIRDAFGPIVILEIQAFGALMDGDATVRDAPADWSPGELRACGVRVEPWGQVNDSRTSPWRHALLGPADGLLKMRSTTQIARNNTEICLLRALYSKRIEHLLFQPAAGEWPFSWHMTSYDIRRLDEHADFVKQSPARNRIAELLR